MDACRKRTDSGSSSTGILPQDSLRSHSKYLEMFTFVAFLSQWIRSMWIRWSEGSRQVYDERADGDLHCEEWSNCSSSHAPRTHESGLNAAVQVKMTTWNKEFKVKSGGCVVNVERANREPYADLFFKTACCRTDQSTKVHLNLEQVDCGVKSFDSRTSTCGLFIYKIVIEVTPKSWALPCERMLLEPYETAEMFGIYRSSNISVQVPIFRPKSSSASYQRSTTISRHAPSFKWSPALRDGAGSNSVTWSWELLTCANGRKLKLKSTRWGAKPKLPLQSTAIHMPPSSFQASVSWEVPSHTLRKEMELEWTIKVSVHTASFRNKHFLGYAMISGPTMITEHLLSVPARST